MNLFYEQANLENFHLYTHAKFESYSQLDESKN